ncbi:MAG: tripartite tricarboxylate transporter permease, partial [Alphaproteobacteria bacterium]|nr:tripartite tricarboxylate transporter permease [Alphaproteobacteria bacterium]
TWGLDPVDSTERMTFGAIHLYDGIPLLPFAIGTLALSSVLSQLYDMRRDRGQPPPAPLPPASQFRAENRISPREFWGNWKTLIRSSCIGTGVGILPGLGVTLAAFLGYGAARRSSPRGDKFGTGELEGIQATEAANSAVVGSNLIPTIALGIPGNVAAALLIGAFTIHGVVPGPLMMVNHAELIYSIFASMLMANLAHLVIGRVGIRIWVQFVRIPKHIVLPTVVLLCVVGVYIPTNSMFDVGMLFLFAGVGYLMRKAGFSIVCLVIGFLLGENFEIYLRQTVLINKADLTVLLTNPVSLAFLLLTLFFAWHFGIRVPLKQKRARAASREARAASD